MTTTDWLSFQKDWNISSLLLLIQRRTTINALLYPVIVILQATHPCVVSSCWMSYHAWVKTWAPLWLFTLCCAHLAVFSFVAKMLINKWKDKVKNAIGSLTLLRWRRMRQLPELSVLSSVAPVSGAFHCNNKLKRRCYAGLIKNLCLTKTVQRQK